MAPFTVNPSRVDPYRNFKFCVTRDGRHVAGVSKVSGLRRSTGQLVVGANAREGPVRRARPDR